MIANMEDLKSLFQSIMWINYMNKPIMWNFIWIDLENYRKWIVFQGNIDDIYKTWFEKENNQKRKGS